MKIDNIRTREEFYEFADVWYQRTHKLREIWQDKTQSTVKREKAYLLFRVMFKRVMNLSKIAMKINQPLPKK